MVTESGSWRRVATDLSWEIAAPHFDRGDLAALRRMDPESREVPALWRIMAQKELLKSPVVEGKWAHVIHGIALMTKTGGSDVASRSAHNRTVPVGRALYFGGDEERTTAFYRDSRFNRLMNARGPMLRSLQVRMFRMLANAGQTFDWGEMAEWILSEGFDNNLVTRIRQNIARHYYTAEYSANRKRLVQEEQVGE